VKPSAQARTSAAKAGWLVAVLFFGWLLFLFLPRPADEATPAPPPAPAPSTSLTRAGLPDYTDWVGLPEIFAIWADRAEWKNGKTRFAYWHPVTKSYAYYFEATRVEGGYRFREIAEPHNEKYEWDSGAPADSPLRLYLPKKPEFVEIPVPRADRDGLVRSAPEKVGIELSASDPMTVPPASPPKMKQ